MILYLDNYRGFSDTYISLYDVNFLVGENSTGKTSVLNIIKILSSPSFMHSQEFEIEGENFGHFRDLISVNSSNKKAFSIGLIHEITPPEKNDSSYIAGFLFTFNEKEGMPWLVRAKYNISETEYAIESRKESIAYKYENIDRFSDENEFSKVIFSKWVNSNFKNDEDYDRIEIPQGILDRSIPLITLFNIFGANFSDEKDKKRSLSRYLHGRFFHIDMKWLAPIRSKPRRTYDGYAIKYSPEGDHTPYVIRKILDNSSESIAFLKSIKKIGTNSGLFESISIKKYGSSLASPFELEVILNKKALNISNVGYGVSQSLPVFVDLLTSNKGTWFALQQPEVHLHPRAQAVIGDFFFDLAVKQNKKFIIETHSDYTIDRFRVNLRKKLKNKPVSQILFFERKSDINSVTPLKISDNGKLPSKQPRSYRDFFIRESVKILDL